MCATPVLQPKFVVPSASVGNILVSYSHITEKCSLRALFIMARLNLEGRCEVIKKCFKYVYCTAVIERLLCDCFESIVDVFNDDIDLAVNNIWIKRKETDVL